MTIFNKILFPLFSLFLLYLSIAIVKQLLSPAPSDFRTLETIILAFLICLYITGIFAFIGFAYPTHKVIGGRYYQLKNPEMLCWIYNKLGVEYFKKLLLLLFWGKQKNRTKYFNGTKAGILNFIYQTKQSEFGHLGAFIIIIIVSIMVLWKGYYILMFSMILINIIGNLYPIILQRHHRIRIEKLLKQ